MWPLRPIDQTLNRLPMYRLLVFGLGLTSISSLVLAATGHLALPFSGLLVSYFVSLASCWLTNQALSRALHVPSNTESTFITALILFLILSPATDMRHALTVAGAGVLAIASKYLLTRNHAHIFNPAAFAALVIGLLGVPPAIWWVGTPVVLPIVVVFGLLVLRKLHRTSLFTLFALSALIVGLIVGLHNHQAVSATLQNLILSGPLVFFGCIMLTEPATLPAQKRNQIIFAVLVGGLFAAQIKLGPLSASPQTALIIGNLAGWILEPKAITRMRFVRRKRIAPDTYDIAFKPEKAFTFQPGQYLEWNQLGGPTDGRGRRRSFSIVSAPHEHEVHIGIKTYKPSSAFKQSLLAVTPGDTLIAGRVSGTFTLPSDPNVPLLWVAGGIGITPFVSMARHIIKLGQKRDIVLFYLVTNPAAAEAYRSDMTAAGIKIVPVLTGKTTPPAGWSGEAGYLTAELLAERASDYKQRQAYLSGPDAMVRYYYGILRQAGIPARRIKRDYFSGY